MKSNVKDLYLNTLRSLLIILGLIIGLSSYTQNLIPNPSFDSLLPNYNYTVIDRELDNNYPHWSNPHQTTPDIFHLPQRLLQGTLRTYYN
jgi:hypothetical protein